MNNNQIIPASPFRDNKRELENPETKIFVNYKDYPIWTANNNCLIQGSRGTGKSSVLRVFEYETHWLKPSNIRTIQELTPYFPDNPDIIGLLYRSDAAEIGIWEKWQNTFEEPNAMILFSTYMHYYFVGQMIKAIIAISKKQNLNYNVPKLISVILEISYPESKKRPELYDYSFDYLYSAIEETIVLIRRFIINLASFNDIEKHICWHTPASTIISDIGKIINEGFPFFNGQRFFFLIDDIDRLNIGHVKVINSMLKVITKPCSFKLTSTKDYQSMVTFDNVAISNTELHISNLNNEEDSGDDVNKNRIDELFDAIFKIRISNIEELNHTYNIKQLFAEDKIDNSLEIVLKDSINPEVKKLYENFKSSDYDKITDYWLISNNIVKKENRKKLDKYRVSAVFSILHKYNLKGSFKYCSYDLIRFISNGSPRNFLKICNVMWENIYYALKNNKIPIDADSQSKAIKKASDDLFENNIPIERFNANIEVSMNEMTERLSQIFIRFISIESLVKTPECISLQIDLKDKNFKEEDKEIYELITDSLIMREAIKIQKDENNASIVKIALNPMLTPHFCLPYRSPFSYSHSIKNPSNLLRLLTSDKDTAQRIIDSIISERINTDPKLF